MHKFKVGDKGKTRNGTSYEVRAILPDLHRPLIVTLTAAAGLEPTLVPYYVEGKLFRDRDSGSDLLPPTKLRYVNLYANGTYFAYAYEDMAKRAGDDPEIVAVAVPIEMIHP